MVVATLMYMSIPQQLEEWAYDLERTIGEEGQTEKEKRKIRQIVRDLRNARKLLIQVYGE